jgi:hypothetical protein
LDTSAETVRSLANGALHQGDLDRMKRNTARQTTLRWQTTDELVAWMRSRMLASMEPQNLGIAESLHAIPPESLAELLAPCASFESIVWSGPADVIQASLDAAGL